jgi:methionyl aminopeptidase
VIVCRSTAEIERLARVNALVARVLAELAGVVRPGVTTAALDALAERRLREAGAEPAFKGYRGYPATICASVNEEVVHGIPSSRALRDGDIVSIDMGAKLGGYFGDAAVTVPVGRISPEAARLLAVTREALARALAVVKPGARVSDIGAAVQSYVEASGFSVVREFVGHGIGTALHEEPQIPNYGVPGRGPRLAEGMVLAIEPMVNQGRPAVKVLDDGWTAVTRDKGLSAHFEHTVVVTAGGCRILTLPDAAADTGDGLSPAPGTSRASGAGKGPRERETLEAPTRSRDGRAAAAAG